MANAKWAQSYWHVRLKDPSQIRSWPLDGATINDLSTSHMPFQDKIRSKDKIGTWWK